MTDGCGHKYLSFLLRLWRVEAEGKTGWHASLTDTRSDNQLGFGSVEALCEFLQHDLDPLAHADGNIAKQRD